MYYKMTQSADATAHARVQMTKEEALIVERVLKELQEKAQDVAYCGLCTINMNTPSQTKNPVEIHKCRYCNEEWECTYSDGECYGPDCSECYSTDIITTIKEGT